MPVRIPYAHVISGIPDVVLAFAFLATWIDPFALGENMVPYLFQVMLLEFIIIHSSGFMSGVMFGGTDKKKKIMMMLALGGFYMLFAGGFALGFQSRWPVITFGGLLLNRMLSVLLGQSPEGEEKEFAMKMWGANVLFYLLSVFAAIILPLPALGVSSDQLSHLDMSGEFVDEPHRMLAWGFLYFLAAGIFELSATKKQSVAPQKTLS